MIIDAAHLRLGRLASFAAKQALLGEEVHILNANQVVITGDKKRVLRDFDRRRKMGTHSTGPFHDRVAFKMLKRTIRGMLPYKQAKGDAAFKRIKCYNGVPDELKDKEAISIKEAHIDNSMAEKFITLKEVCSIAGGKSE